MPDLLALKAVAGVGAVALIFIGFVPYFSDLLRRKTRPHVYSWLLWGLITLVAFALQLNAGGGAGAIVTLIAGLVSLAIAGLAFIFHGKRDVEKSDTVFLVITIIAVAVWLIVKSPELSTILVSAVNLLSFIPTIRKSWRHPYSETLATSEINTLRFVLAILALQNYNLVTLLYPITWLCCDGLFSIMIIFRRRVVRPVRL